MLDSDEDPRYNIYQIKICTCSLIINLTDGKEILTKI